MVIQISTVNHSALDPEIVEAIQKSLTAEQILYIGPYHVTLKLTVGRSSLGFLPNNDNLKMTDLLPAASYGALAPVDRQVPAFYFQRRI